MLGRREGGRNHDLPAELVCLKVAKHFQGETFCFSDSFGYRKTLGLRREYHDFLKKNYCPTALKTSAGNTIVCHYFRLSKNFHP